MGLNESLTPAEATYNGDQEMQLLEVFKSTKCAALEADEYNSSDNDAPGKSEAFSQDDPH